MNKNSLDFEGQDMQNFFFLSHSKIMYTVIMSEKHPMFCCLYFCEADFQTFLTAGKSMIQDILLLLYPGKSEVHIC